jgi:hypothetical protein
MSMLSLIVLFFYIIAPARVHGKTLVVKVDYPSSHSGWFHIHVRNYATIHSIMWCAELMNTEPRRDIQDCLAPALLRKQVFPSTDASMYRFEEHGQLIKINPECIHGGFWNNRQANIVLHGKVNNDQDDFEQVVRINPLIRLPNGETSKMIEDNDASYVPVQRPNHHEPIILPHHTNALHKDAQGTMDQETIHPQDVEEEKEKEEISSSSSSDAKTQDAKTEYPMTTLSLVLALGMVLACIVLVLAIVSNRKKIVPLKEYTLSTLKMPKNLYGELEDDLRIAMHEDFVILNNDQANNDQDAKTRQKEYEEYLQDQAILHNLG